LLLPAVPLIGLHQLLLLLAHLMIHCRNLLKAKQLLLPLPLQKGLCCSAGAHPQLRL
jgi:hypothetical protein